MKNSARKNMWRIFACFCGFALIVIIIHYKLYVPLWLTCIVAIPLGALDFWMHFQDVRPRIFRPLLLAQSVLGIGLIGISFWHFALWFFLIFIGFVMGWLSSISISAYLDHKDGYDS